MSRDRSRSRDAGTRDGREDGLQTRRSGGREETATQEEQRVPAPRPFDARAEGIGMQQGGAPSQRRRGPASADDKFEWGGAKDEDTGGENAEEQKGPVEAPDFGLSGALAKDTGTGNMYKGVELKWSEPADARQPTKKWRLYVFKGAADAPPIETLHISRQSAFLVGKNKTIADIWTAHPSCSGQHAVIQFRLKEKVNDKDMTTIRTVRPYLMDLESTNGTYLNRERIEPARFYELKEQDSIVFGMSSREYVLLHDKSA